jgi:tetratricopeptide (TPR) repeat protein
MFYHTKGQVYERQELPELYENAIEEFKKAIAINDMHAQSYFHLGGMYHLKKLLDEALVCYNKVIELETNKEEVYLAKGKVLLAKGDSFCALSDFDQAIELNLEDLEQFMYRGIAKLRLKQFESAIEDFNT